MKRTVRLNKSEFKGLVKECAVEYFNETANKQNDRDGYKFKCF